MDAFRKRWWVWPILIIAVPVCIGWSLDWPLITKYRENRCRSEHTLINADVVCGSPDVISKTGYAELQSNVEQYIASQIAAGNITETSVYYRDLVRGPTFGVNELADFAPASLLKLPLAIVFLISAERQPEVLSQKILLQGQTDVDQQNYAPHVTAEVGKEHTIEELLRLMIEYSDNASYSALEGFIGNNQNRMVLRQEIFQEIGLIDPKDRVEETITVRGYASLFRLLYNVSYLNAENSERLLGWLSEADYRSGLVAGVPEHIRVAHKFGERETEEYRMLNDCGIIYYPNNPYLLCIMTKGSDWTKLEETIRTISRMTYEEVDSRRLE